MRPFPRPWRLFIFCFWLSAVAAEDAGVRVEAERLREEHNVVRAEGNVRLRREEDKLCAAHVQYNRINGWAQADGDVKLENKKGVIHGDHIRYHFADRRGEIKNFNAELNDGGLAVRGAVARLGDGALSANDAVVSSCPQDNEIWRLFAAGATNQDEAQSLTVRNARFELYGVPVAYTPYASFYHGDDPKNGLLRPTANIKDGINVALPYYYRIAHNYDWTVTPSWRAQHGMEIGNEWRFLTPNARGEVNLNAVLFGDEGRDRQSLHYQYRRDNFYLHVNADNVSDNHYLRDFSDDDDDQATRTLPRAATLEYAGDDWRIAATAENFKSLDDNLTAPHRMLPRLSFFQGHADGDFTWEGELQYTRFLHHQTAQQKGGRYLARGAISRYFYFSGLSLLVDGGLHAVRYDNDRGGDADFAVPHGRLDMRWRPPLDNYHLRGAFVYAPTVKQDTAPLYDTELKQQTLENLYEWNRFVGGDRAADAKFVAYGADYNRENDDDALFFGFGQRYYFRSPQVVLASEAPPKKGFSDVLMETALRWNKTWKVNADLQWNPRNGEVTRFFTDTQARFSDRRLLHAAYLSDRVESATLGGAMPLGDLVEAATNANYSLNSDRLTRSFIALRVRSSCDCWSMTAKISNSLVGTNDNDVEFSIGMEFTGLGGIGSNYDSLLDDLI